MPESADKRPVSDQDINAAVARFESSGLYRSLQANGVDVQRLKYTPTNFRRILAVQGNLFNDNTDRNHTILGEELFVKRGNQANAGWRKLKSKALDYMAWNKSQGHAGRTFWQDKEFASWDVSKAAWDSTGAAETVAHFTGTIGRKNPEDLNFELLRPHILQVLEKWDKLFNEMTIERFSSFDSWLGQMNWNRNSGHPFNMPISKERFTSVDLPNWYPFYAKVASAQSLDNLEELLEGGVPGWGNVLMNWYTMFGRPNDRVILGTEHVLKGPGAFFNNSNTKALRPSRVSYTSTEENHRLQSQALAFDDAIMMMDDIKKYDRNFERGLMEVVYECVAEGDHLSKHPELRNFLIMMLREFVRDGRLILSPTHFVDIVKGLPSGHPLTQWIGSLVHLAIYEFWTEHYGLDVVYEQVLSDDGMRVVRGITLEEAENLMFGELADSIKQFGFELHPEKTVVVDPTDEVEIGYRTDLDRSVMLGDSAFFLKQFPNRDLGGAHGNPIGIINSMLQVERPPSDEFRESVDPHLLGYDIGLGGRVPTAIYDLARLVDIIASAGIGNPLIDDMIKYVQTTWPSFSTRGVKILEEKLDLAWRSDTTYYAGGTLDSGISRKRVVEELLDLEREPIWTNQVFARSVA